jgi:hypothetical protein
MADRPKPVGVYQVPVKRILKIFASSACDKIFYRALRTNMAKFLLNFCVFSNFSFYFLI